MREQETSQVIAEQSQTFSNADERRWVIAEMEGSYATYAEARHMRIVLLGHRAIAHPIMVTG